MTPFLTAPAETPEAPSVPPMPDRLVASIEGAEPGPTTIFVAAIHGNEPAGYLALRRTLAELAAKRPRLRGRVHAVIGHRSAFALGVRMIDRDLNRAFGYRRSDDGPRLAPPDDAFAVEARERAELLALMKRLVDAGSPGHAVHVVDLHTFSAEGAPFSVFADTLRTRRYAACWPVPMILGLAESLRGTLIDYLTEIGCIAAVVETGRHDDPESAVRHESVIRLAIAAAGHLDAADLPELPADRERLAEAAAGTPAVLDVQARRGVDPEDGFRMRPGYRNFDPVDAGDLLADDARGPVRAERRGRILMPLYQAQGDDGYFIARPIGRAWLALSAALRRLGLPAVARRLPGIHEDPGRPGVLRVDRRVARFVAIDLFHLLGYRVVERDATHLVVARRHFDFHGPDRVAIETG